ncbi:hypothetical protein DL766_000076 [Monosporascus sp. MC13-8B]|nr:hypothetical protein DL766_000076 [Monosporascus sp. MC13-8B]
MDTSSSTSLPPSSPSPPSSIPAGRVIATTNITAANSPSNASYSSGASCLSTRNTSPDHAVAVISVFPIDKETATSPGHSKSSSSSSCSQIAASSSSSSPSPLVELRLKTDIKYTPNTLLDTGDDNNYNPTSVPLTQTAPANAKMDRNPFQSVNDRRSKMAMDRGLHQHPTGSPVPSPAIAQFQFHQLQNTSLGPSGGSGSGTGGSGGSVQALGSPIQPAGSGVGGGLLPPAAPRGLASSNWRAGQPILDDASSSSSRANSSAAAAAAGMYNPFDPTAGGSSRHHHHSSFHGSSFSPQLSGTGGTAEVVAAGSGPVFSDAQLDASYAYCFDRGNGQFTRLVPADMLPPLRDVPAVQQGCAGMLVLPLPRAAPPGGRSGNANVSTEPVGFRSRIDNIVASTPSTPTHHQPPTSSSTAAGHHSHAHSHSHPHPPSLATSSANPGLNTTNTNKKPPPHPGSHHHNHHPHHHHQPHQQHNQQQQPQRRPKIYCDKWVHEGVCAFTQQGCKYKHEMPFDKVTQHQLGLFHGFPAWWKKHQAELARQRDPVPPPSPLDNAGGAGGRDSRGGGGCEDDEERLVMGVGERFLTSRSGAAGVGGGAGVGVGMRGERGEGAVGGHGVDADGGGMMLGGAGRLGAAGAPAAGFAWRRGPIVPSNAGLGIGVGVGIGEHPGDAQVGNMATSMATQPARSGTLGSSGLQRGVRNPLAVSYGSPFGPIAPPARASAAATASAAASASVAKTAGPGSKATSSGAPTSTGANPSGPTAGAGASIPTANPYASLEVLDDEDRLSKDVVNSTAVSENWRENEGESGSIGAKKANADAPRFAQS